MAENRKETKVVKPVETSEKGHPGRITQDGHPGRQSMNEGYTGQEVSRPHKVQGGFTGETSQAPTTPPTGGPTERPAPSKVATKKE